MVLRLSSKNLKEVIAKSLSILKKGGIIAYPTETFYGLGAKYDLENALERLYEIKKRPIEKAMPLIIGDIEQLPLLTEEIKDTAKRLIKRFWPGPLTMVFNARANLSQYLVSDKKVAVRIPGESFALRLALASGFPITSTSANLSGMPPASNAEMVCRYFKEEIDLIIDGGETKVGLPSTIIDVTGEEIKLIRKGAIDISDYINVS